MAGQGINRERILVCVSASPTSSDVIRRAARLSRAVDAELIALYVEDSETQTDVQEKAVEDGSESEPGGQMEDISDTKEISDNPTRGSNQY